MASIRWLAAIALLAGTATIAATPADTALIAAIRTSDVDGATAALRARADPNRRLAFAATPLGWAVETQDAAMVDLLLAHGARPNDADADGVTPLALACERGSAPIIVALLAAHADVRSAGPDGTTPLAICARYGPAAAVERMLAAGATADAVDSRGQTPLMWAAASGRIDAIDLLLRAGADANRVSRGGFTPLFFAVKSGVPAATARLLAAGADAGYRGPEHTSAAQLAAYQANWGALALLVAHGGVDLAERDREGRPLLAVAAAGDDPALVALLLAKGADANGVTGPSRITWVTEANFGVAPRLVPPTPPLADRRRARPRGGHGAAARRRVRPALRRGRRHDHAPRRRAGRQRGGARGRARAGG